MSASRLAHIYVSLTADPYICHLMADPYICHLTADPYICHLTADPYICHLTAGSSLSQQFGPNLAPWGPMPGGVGGRQPPHYMGPYWAFKGALLPYCLFKWNASSVRKHVEKSCCHLNAFHDVDAYAATFSSSQPTTWGTRNCFNVAEHTSLF